MEIGSYLPIILIVLAIVFIINSVKAVPPVSYTHLTLPTIYSV